MSIIIQKGKVYVSRNSELWVNPRQKDNDDDLWLLDGPDGNTRLFWPNGYAQGRGNEQSDLMSEANETSVKALLADAQHALTGRAALFVVKSDAKRELADEAVGLIGGDRAKDYGDAQENFARIARFWDAYFKGTGRNIDVTAADVAPLMRFVKEARLCTSPGHRDSHVDLIGYTLLGAEINGVAKKNV
jgi:hypothetical protein